MTLPQIELWGHLAAQERDNEARMVAARLSEPMAELVKAMFKVITR